MAKRLIVVAGNIGAGKTSLTERIGTRLGWETAFESVSDNPYLSDFYANMRAWSFHLQIFFLGHRADQYLELARSPQSAILDRSIYEDAQKLLKQIIEDKVKQYQYFPLLVIFFLHAPFYYIFG